MNGTIATLPGAEVAIKVSRAVIPTFIRDRLVDNLSSQDMRTLLPGKWLNDEVINFYGVMIGRRAAKAEQEKIDGFLKVHVFTTFFWSKLFSAGYMGVRRWTRKVRFWALLTSSVAPLFASWLPPRPGGPLYEGHHHHPDQLGQLALGLCGH